MCTPFQTMYQELSKKVDKISYNAAVDLMMIHHDECKDSRAWDSANVNLFEICTNAISKSSSKIYANMDKVKVYCMKFLLLYIFTIYFCRKKS